MRVTVAVVDDAGNKYEGSLILSPMGGGGRAARTQSRTPAQGSLAERILLLRKENFFAEPKTAPEVHEKLKPTYACDLNRVEVALLRLQKRKHLRKTSKLISEQAKIAYVA